MSITFKIPSAKKDRYYFPFILWCYVLKGFNQGSFGDLVYVNYVVDEFSYLNITSVSAYLIEDANDCGFACLENTSCFSYNLAASPDSNGKLLCELLPSDKYNNPDKFVSNKFFHHFSISVSGMVNVCYKGCNRCCYFSIDKFNFRLLF